MEQNEGEYHNWMEITTTIRMLLNKDSSNRLDDSIKAVLNITQNPENSGIFIFNTNSSISYEEYNEMTNKYKAFTLWLLNRFFFFLSEEKLTRIHHLIVEAQLNILRNFKYAQIHIYHELSKHYISSFKQLVDYTSKQEKIKLNAFIAIPATITNLDLTFLSVEIDSMDKNVDILKFTLYFIEDILCHCLSTCYINKEVYSILTNLLYALKLCDTNIKLRVLEIYKEIFKFMGKISIDIDKYIHRFNEHVKQLIIKQLSHDNLSDFLKFQTHYCNLLENLPDESICEFIVVKKLERNIEISSDLINICSKYINKELKQQLGCSLKHFIKDIINDILTINEDVYLIKTSCIWLEFSTKINDLFESNNCFENCTLYKNMQEINKYLDASVYIKYEFTKNNSKSITLFNEDEFLINLINHICLHLKNCNCQLDYITFISILKKILYLNQQQYKLLYDLVSYLINNQPKQNIQICSSTKLQEKLLYLYNYFNSMDQSEEIFEAVCQFMEIACICLTSEELYILQDDFYHICDKWFTEQKSSYQVLVAKYIKILFYKTLVTEDANKNSNKILNLLLTSKTTEVLEEITSNLSEIILISCTEYQLSTFYENNKIIVKVLNDYVENNSKVTINENISKEFVHNVLRAIIRLLNNDNNQIQINLIRTLPLCGKFSLFYRVQPKKWLKLLTSENQYIRNIFAQNIHIILINLVEQGNITWDKKKELIECIFMELKYAVKESITSKHYLQETLLLVLENVSKIESDLIELNILKLLLFFIMMPELKHSLVAINIINEISRARNTTSVKVFRKHRRKLCAVIAKLSILYYDLAPKTLCTSMESVAFSFGYKGPKHFISEETRHLLPYYVILRLDMPKVDIFISEIAYINQFKLSELFETNFGYIFLHIALEDTDNYENVIKYLENVTATNSNILRKRSFMTIINELLLNIDEKYEEVMYTLKNLASEEATTSENLIQNFLQCRLLGVFKYFDLKLIAPHFSKEIILKNLIKIFDLMGTKCITQLRFKIIAMLQTALQFTINTNPELNCAIWNKFIRYCEIEVVGPHLATIFVTILPLLKHNKHKINEIFKYLLVDNENQISNYISDLFFINFVENKCDIDFSILEVIKLHLTIIAELPLKEHLNHFMKYLYHETPDIRKYCLKYIKNLLKSNRKQLDSLILGYNGISQVIIDLLEALTLGCRNEDTNLRLAYGECLAELGAIEPSHIPRRYAQQKVLSLSISEPIFIKNSLMEFTKALQAEQNTQNMDRFSLAIQETLKTYKISTNTNSENYEIWNSFSESQKELMLPLLSSKYAIVNPVEDFHISPIYGSSLGTNFQDWAYNWTASLVASIKSEDKNIFHVYLPSIKQSHTILMHFLPYILLRVLTEGNANDEEKICNEFNVILFGPKKQKLPEDVFNLRPIRLTNFVCFGKNQGFEVCKNDQYVKVIFVLIDFLERWMRQCLQSREAISLHTKIYKFLNKFCKLKLAKCNFIYGEYPRALMYLETYMSETKLQSNELLAMLSEIYYHLDEPDGVTGVAALRQEEPKLEERIIALEIAGQLSEAAACYERLSLPLNLFHIKGLLQCYLDLDNVNTALNFIKGARGHYNRYGNWLLEAQAEPLWRLGCYDELDELLKRNELKDNRSWSVQLGHALISFRNSDQDSFNATLKSIKTSLVDFVYGSSLEEGAYQQNYVNITRLHVLVEMEQVEQLVNELLLRPNDKNVSDNFISSLKQEWELRLNIVQQSVRILEPILCLRRILLEQAKQLIKRKVPHAVGMFDNLIAELWLKSSKFARRADAHQQAYTYIIKAEEFHSEKVYIQKAKLHWAREEHELALTTLQRGLSTFISIDTRSSNINSFTHLTNDQKRTCAKGKLLFARYNEELSNMTQERIINNYKDIENVLKEWEKSYVYMAQYLDKISKSEETAQNSDVLNIFRYFCESLKYGTTFVHQSMPRLLSIWFDYGSQSLNETNSKIKQERRRVLHNMTSMINKLTEEIPLYIFFTAFSQLISRICHPHKDIYMEIYIIIRKLIMKYPQHSLWMLISVIKSSYSLCSKRCIEMLDDQALKTPVMTKLIKDFKELAEKLIELCTKKIPEKMDQTTVTMDKLSESLLRLFKRVNFSEILLPTQKYRKLILPNSDFNTSQHIPFPNHCAYIVGVKNEMTILNTLQKPRKITFIGSDGKYYSQLLKSKDDLRIDFRLMEFNDIVNQLLSKNAESRQRRLYIRLYSVVPFNEDCGMIEWVENMVGMRLILTSIYKQRKVNQREISQFFPKLHYTLEEKRNIYITKLLPKHPPVLGEWFRRTFPDVQNWFLARTTYIRTTAVMSMVGYIVGLGDRHGENLLIDKTCGDLMHVDFGCLFNKGELLEWPERVPFRLTHNMVNAMGPLGVEGLFRKSCACTLGILRTNTNTLISSITPLVYDPIVDWRITDIHSAIRRERVNDMAKKNIAEIEKRLKGLSKPFSTPLSVEGQTNYLIIEAMDINNLCQMFCGWGAFL